MVLCHETTLLLILVALVAVYHHSLRTMLIASPYLLQVKTVTVNKSEVESKSVTVTKPETKTYVSSKQVCTTVPAIPIYGGSGYGW